VNGRLEPYQLAEIHRHLDDRDAQYDRMQSVPVEVVLEAIPDRDVAECGKWILEAVGKAMDLPSHEGDALIRAALVKIEAEYMHVLREVA
jgi:hypothetical protein